MNDFEIPMIDEFYPLATAGTFAISSVIIKRMQSYGSALLLNFYRTVISAFLFLLVLISRNMFIDLLQLDFLAFTYLFISVVLNVVIGDSIFFYSQEKVGVRIATPIINTYPLLSILIAVIFLDEMIGWIFVMGSLVIIFGIILVAGGSDTSNTSKLENMDYLKGVSAAFVSMFCYALGVVALTVASTGIDPIVANSVRLPVASILMLLIYFLLELRRSRRLSTSIRDPIRAINVDPPNTRQYFVIMIFISAFLGTYLSSLYYVLSTQKLGAGVTAVLTSVGPLFALPLAAYWLKERISPRIVLGTLLTIIGLWIVLWF